MTGEGDGLGRLWDAHTGREAARFEGHSDRVEGVAFSQDGRVVVTASWDGTARFWRAATGEPLGMLVAFGDESNSWVVIDPDGHFDTSGVAATGHLHWVEDGRPPVVKPAGAFPDRLRPGLLAEVIKRA